MTPPSAAPLEESVASIELAASHSQTQSEVVFEAAELDIQVPQTPPLRLKEQSATKAKPPKSRSKKTPSSKGRARLPVDHSYVDVTLTEAIDAVFAEEQQEIRDQIARESNQVEETQPTRDSSTEEQKTNIEPKTSVAPIVVEPTTRPTEANPKTTAQRRKSTEPKPRPETKQSTASVASKANAGTKVDQLPQKLPSNLPPTYPQQQWSNGVEGRVILRVRVGSTGIVDRISVYRTSGVKAFDSAALKAVRSWRFNPARRGDDAVAYEIAVPIRFRIDG